MGGSGRSIAKSEHEHLQYDLPKTSYSAYYQTTRIYPTLPAMLALTGRVAGGISSDGLKGWIRYAEQRSSLRSPLQDMKQASSLLLLSKKYREEKAT